MNKLTIFESLDALTPDARAFLSNAESENIGFGPTWYGNLIRTVYAQHSGIRFYVVLRGNATVAVVPVRVDASRLGCSISALGNFYTTLYHPAFATDLQAHELVPLLTAWQQGQPAAEMLQFAPMDPASRAYVLLLQASKLAGWYPFEYFSFGNWYLPVKMCWKDYLASRDGMLRSTLKRMGKKFASEGGTLQIVTEANDMPAAIAAYEKVYAQSWKKPEPYPNFMPGLIDTCVKQGWLRLGIAWLNGQAVASQVWIVAHGRAEIYKLAYDEAFKPYAPGTLLSAMLMQHVFEVDMVGEVDYLVGDDPYKKTWMSHRRERWGIVAYNPRTPMGLAGLVREALGRAVKPWIVRICAKRPLPGK